MVGNTILIILVFAMFFQILTLRRDLTRRLDELANRLARIEGAGDE